MFPLCSAFQTEDAEPGSPEARGGPGGLFSGRREIERIRAQPERRLLSEGYVPALAQEGGWILWIGCRPDTVADYARLEAEGGVVWTLDRRPAAARWGQVGRHRTGDVREADAVFSTLRFNAIVCSDALGHGVEAPAERRQALQAMTRLLQRGGRLILGWNAGRAPDPLSAGELPRGLTPWPLAGRAARVVCGAQVYDSLLRTE